MPSMEMNLSVIASLRKRDQLREPRENLIEQHADKPDQENGDDDVGDREVIPLVPDEVANVGAAAGKITVNARLTVPTSSVRATLIHSLRTAATPNAVFSSIGHTEQMKMTKIADSPESLMV